MARKRRNRNRNFVAIPFQVELAVTNLNAGSVVEAGILTTTEDLFVISIDAMASLEAHTPGEGPIEWGYGHQDLTATEMSEALSAEQLTPEDIIANERGRRPVRRGGTFTGLNTAEVLNDGKTIRTKFRRAVGERGLSVYALNLDSNTLTAGSLINLNGTIYGRWQV